MAKVATRGPLPPDSLRFGGGGNVTGAAGASSMKINVNKRKTPSEYREEMLKRKDVVDLVDEFPAPVLDSVINGVKCGSKPDSSKAPNLVSTHVTDLFPVKKNNFRARMLSEKNKAKEKILAEQTDSSKVFSFSSEIASERQPPTSCPKDSLASTAIRKEDATIHSHQTAERNGNTFRSVTDLSMGVQKLPEFSHDLDKAFQGLAAQPVDTSACMGDSFEENTSASFCSEFLIPERTTPLDFTLKTCMRVVSSSSLNWFHRLMSSGMTNFSLQFSPQVGHPVARDTTRSSPFTSNSQISSLKPLHSLVYPQSTLPPSVVSALTLSNTEGGQMDFLSKRRLAWEDSFRSLYYMLRKNICNIFYVCTAQFVAMFAGGDGLAESKVLCHAYISQSTRGLRSSLKEQGVFYSMPFCHSKMEQVNSEDLVELSEIEKHNLGQTRRTSSSSDVDNTPESLLMFSGHENVHGLYDFLLNYRFLLTSLNAVDVPLLYSAVPFQNASLSAPEVRCKEIKKADYIFIPYEDHPMASESNQDSASGFTCSLEIRDAYLPPWIIRNVCDAMESNGCSFEASFVTEPTSAGLNVCLKSNLQATAGEGLQKNSCPFGIPNTIISPKLHSGYLKGLKYNDGSYTASLSPV